MKVPAGKVYMHPDRMRAEKLDSFKMLDARAAAVLPQRFFNDGLDSTSEFFISSTEVTNIQWKEFLMYLKQEGRMEEYNANVLNTTVWRQRLAYNEPFVNYYYQHQTYSEYPAVGMHKRSKRTHTSPHTHTLHNGGSVHTHTKTQIHRHTHTHRRTHIHVHIHIH